MKKSFETGMSELTALVEALKADLTREDISEEVQA